VKKRKNSVKKGKAGPLIILVLEIMVIIVMHAVKINKTGGAMKTVAGMKTVTGVKTVASMQQFPAGRVLLGAPKPPYHVPELFEDCLAAAAAAKTIFSY
jgi:hypothetical protein